MSTKVYIETYGCQMNVADTELVQGILKNRGFGLTDNLDDANVILLNTCSVRDNAEQRIYGRLGNLKKKKRSIRARLSESWVVWRKDYAKT